MIYEYFRVTGVHDAVLGCAGLFVLALRGGGVQEFDTRWDEILSSTNNIPADDALKNLYKLRGVSLVSSKTMLEMYELEIHQNMSKPYYQKLKIYGEEDLRERDQDTKLSSQK